MPFTKDANAQVIQTNTNVGTPNSTVTDNLNGKIGTDTEMADNSLYDLIGADAKTNALAAALFGAAGIGTWLSAAAPGSNVSMHEVIRAIYDAVGSRLLAAGTAQGQPVMVTRATAALPGATTDQLFTIAGGNVEILSLIGEITTAPDTANATKLLFDPTASGASQDLCGTLDINAMAIGTLLTITGTVATALKNSLLHAVPADNLAGPLLLAPGTIDIDCVGSDSTARLEWHIVYRALEAGATVVAA